MCLVNIAKVFKSVEVVDFLQFQEHSILSVGVSIISIKHHCLVVVTSNIHPKIDLCCILFLISLGSLEEAVHLLSVIHTAAELLPSSLVDEVINF